jgi:hypothetical protein
MIVGPSPHLISIGAAFIPIDEFSAAEMQVVLHAIERIAGSAKLHPSTAKREGLGRRGLIADKNGAPCRIKMRTLMSLKSRDMRHVELFRPPSPQMSVLDPQAAIKRDMPDFRVGPRADIRRRR